jgi:hypothetical protein
VHSGVQHIIVLCCVLLFFVLCILCCQFLWIVNFWLPLRYSLTFIYSNNLLILALNPLHSLAKCINPQNKKGVALKKWPLDANDVSLFKGYLKKITSEGDCRQKWLLRKPFLEWVLNWFRWQIWLFCLLYHTITKNYQRYFFIFYIPNYLNIYMCDNLWIFLLFENKYK